MTVQELVDYCNKNGISLDTHITMNAKDDYFLTEDRLSLDNAPYFGNCSGGQDWEKEFAPRDADGEIDWKNFPNFLMIHVRG